LKDILKDTVITLPVGMAAQDAAIAAIWVLGQRHETLMAVAIQALEFLSVFKQKVAQGYLDDLRKKYAQNCLAMAKAKNYA
jgi:hypothetical protein